MKHKTFDTVESFVYFKNFFIRKKAIFRRIRNYSILILPIFFCFLFSSNILVLLLFSSMWFCFYSMFITHEELYFSKYTINVWFGVPGAGKTTMAALLTRNSLLLGIPVLSNVPIRGSFILDVSDLGKYNMGFNGVGSHVVLDESSIYFDNRNFKQFAQSSASQFFSLHRHMRCRVDVFSQGYDVDKRIRDRASSSGLFYLKKSIIPNFVYYRRISRVLTINKDDQQLIDGFKFYGFPRFVYAKSVYRSFDSFDNSLCPSEIKHWDYWEI